MKTWLALAAFTGVLATSSDALAETQKDNPFGVCPQAQMLICIEDRCACAAPSNGPGQPKPLQCAIVVKYTEGRPDQPSLHMNNGACAVDSEVALVMALASLLKATQEPVPMGK